MKNLNKEKFLCSGCGLCSNVCPTKAITMPINKEGFYHYKIDEKKCIECGICIKQCPVLNYKNENKINERKVYAAYIKEKSILMNSTSGGVFSALAKYIVSKNGVVIGATLDEKVKHISVDNEKEIKSLRGSKYLQSFTGDIYNEAKKHLNKGKLVLFTGTPCQCSAMRKMISHDNLYIVDIACHGVPSYKVFDKANMDRFGNKISGIIRTKNKSWTNFLNEYYINGKLTHKTVASKDSFLMGFTKNYYLNDICYKCKFSDAPHSSDITIGDFWGINKSNPRFFLKNRDRGVSVVIINNSKGEELFKNIINQLEYVDSSYEDAFISNTRIGDGTYSNEIKKRKDSFDINIDFSKKIYRTKKISVFKKILSKIKTIILSILKNK